MEAGYDYTLLGGRPRSNARFLPALFVAALAGVLLISGLAYYGFASYAQADQVSATVVSAGAAKDSSFARDQGTDEATKYTRYVSPASSQVISGQQLYPAGFAEARHWVNPLGFEP